MSYNGFKIGSFNMRDLDYKTKIENDPDNKSVTREFELIGRVIRENFDVVAMQEVLSPNPLRQIFAPGSGWKYTWHRTFSKSSEPSSEGEGYAFAWNERELQLMSANIWKQYKHDPKLTKAGLLRQPYYARFIPAPSKGAAPYCELRLINTHIRYSPKINKNLELSDRELRRREFFVLATDILDRIRDKPGDSGRLPYTVLLGDYNLNLRSSNKSPYIGDNDYIVVELPGGRERIYVTVQDQLTTLSHSLETDPATGKAHIVFNPWFSNNYDHFTYDKDFFQTMCESKRIDILNTVSLYHNNDFEGHFRGISDHIPIIMEINLK